MNMGIYVNMHLLTVEFVSLFSLYVDDSAYLGIFYIGCMNVVLRLHDYGNIYTRPLSLVDVKITMFSMLYHYL